MKIIAANNAFSTLATLGAPAATTLRLAPGGGELFEEPILGKEYFVGTLSDRTGALNEIVWVTERIGDVLTVMRAQENTLAQSWPVGTRFQNLITAGSLLASIGSIHDPVEITPINDSYTLIAAESGNTYSNDGAIHVVEVTLPIDAPNGTQYTFLSVESNVGIRIKRPGVGVFLSYDEKMGVDIASYTKGSSCKLVKTNEATWTVTEASTPEAWLITEPSEEDFSPEIIFWRDRVRTGGGEPLLATMVAYEQFIQSEKFYGLWAKTVDYAMLWKQSTENQAVALTSLKLGLRLVANNGPWSMDGLGYSFDGMASDITWPVILSVQGSSIMSPTDQRIEVYVVSSLGKNSQVIGSNSGGGASLGIKPLQNSLMRINFGSQTADFLLPQNADGHSLGGGLSAGSRTAASLNIIQGYKNGVKFPDVTTPTPMLTGLSSQSISIGSYNSIGAALSFVEATVAYASVGAPFTEEEEAIRWTILSRLIALNRAEFFDPKATEE